MHCGGPTGRPDGGVIAESWQPPSSAAADEYPDPLLAMPDQDERELEMSDPPSSIGRSLIRSLGGFVWVVVLIGFTLSRNCGGD